jgi:hypothetical protein
MSLNQALVHRVILILGRMLQNSPALTYVDKKVIELYDRIRAGDLELYKTIQNNLGETTGFAFNELFKCFDIENYMPRKHKE